MRENVKDDLYSFSAIETSCSMVQTTGDVPSPRVGHASALVSSVLIVWGGDTKTSDAEKQDSALYLLNLGWHHFSPSRYPFTPIIVFPQVRASGPGLLLLALVLLGGMGTQSRCVEQNSTSMAARSMASS